MRSRLQSCKPSSVTDIMDVEGDNSIRCRLFIGGGATLNFARHCVDEDKIRDCDRIQKLSSIEKTIPDDSYIEFKRSNRLRNFQDAIDNDAAKSTLETRLGFSLEKLDALYLPANQPEGTRIRLYFTKGSDIYYEEITRDNGLHTELVVGNAMDSNTEALKQHIHPAIHYEVARRAHEEGYIPPQNRQVVICALPSKSYARLLEQQMLHQYKALGVLPEHITVLDENTPKEKMVELIQKTDLMDISGGDQSRLLHELSKEAVEALKNKTQDKNFALITTSASAAALGDIMITGGGSYNEDKNPCQIGNDSSYAEVRVARGLGVLPDILVDTHQLSYANNKQKGFGRPRQHRDLTVLCAAQSNHSEAIFGFNPSDNLKAIGVAEGTFALIEGNTLKVMGNKDNEGQVLVIDPKAFTSSSVTSEGSGVYQLQSVKARLRNETLKELIFTKADNALRSKLTTNPNDSLYNKIKGIRVLAHGESLDLIGKDQEPEKWRSATARQREERFR